MLPGTYAYVTTGHVGKAVLMENGGGDGLSVAPWQVVLGLGASLLAIGYIGQLAKRAVEEADAEALMAGEAHALSQAPPHGAGPAGAAAGGAAAAAAAAAEEGRKRQQ